MLLQSLDQLLEVVITGVYRAWYNLPRRNTLPELGRLRLQLADKLAALPRPVDMTVYEQAIIDFGAAIRTLPGVVDAAGQALVALADLADAVPAAQRTGFALLRKTDAAPERIDALVTLLRAENPSQVGIARMVYVPEQAAATWQAVWAALGFRLDEIPGEERSQIEAIRAQCDARVDAAQQVRQIQEAYLQCLQALEKIPAAIRVAGPIFVASKHVSESDKYLRAPLEASDAQLAPPAMPEFAAMAPAPPPPPQDVSFFAAVRFPGGVKSGEVQWLTVQLTLEAIDESVVTATVPVRFETSSPKELPPPEFVEVRLVAPGFSELTGVWERTMTVYPQRDSQPATFLLMSDKLDAKRLSLDFVHKGRMIASIAFKCVVVEGNAAATEQSVDIEEMQEMAPLAENLPPADLVLRVVRRAKLNSLSFMVSSSLPQLPLNSQPVGELKLTDKDPQAFFTNRLQRLSDLAAMPDSTTDGRMVKEIESLGEGLFELLMPLPLQKIYWEQIKPLVDNGELKTMLIISDESWIPWELIKPYLWNDSNNTEEKADFLVEQVALSRWLARPLPLPHDLEVTAAALVAPDVNLPSVQAETTFFTELSSQHHVTFQGPLDERDKVINSLRDGKFQILHFAGHGSFDAANADQSELSLTDGSLTQSDLMSRDLRAIRMRQPLVFLNACNSGQVALSLTGLGRWGDVVFRDACASAFVGTLWEVSGNLAAEFARAFYLDLAAGRTLGEALRQARLYVRGISPSDPTWLAYALFGDPSMRVHFRPRLASTPSDSESQTYEIPAVTEWYVEWTSVPTRNLSVFEFYTLELHFSRIAHSGAARVAIPHSSQALTVFIDATPGLHMDGNRRIYVPVVQGELLQDQFELRFCPVIDGTVQITATVFVGREVEGAPAVEVPGVSLRVSSTEVFQAIPEVFDRRLIAPPHPDLLIYVALQAIPAELGASAYNQIRIYVTGTIVDDGFAALPPLELTLEDVASLNSTAASVALGGNQAPPTSAALSLRRFGMTLYDLLMPPDDERSPSLRTLYWRLNWLAHHTGRFPKVLIVSDPGIALPWELVRPYSGTGKEEDFFAAQFVMAHWIGRINLRPDKMAPTRRLELVHYGQHTAEIPLWITALGGSSCVISTGNTGDLHLTQLDSDVVGLHLLRYNEADVPGIVVSAEPANGSGTSDTDIVAAAAKQRRLDFAARRPIVGLSFVDASYQVRGVRPTPISTAHIDAWAGTLLRAEASAVIGPRWPTIMEADRYFYTTFYAAIRAGQPLSEAVHTARLALRATLPDSGDWLAYSYYGHPACEPYQVVRTEAFASLEVIGTPENQPLLQGRQYTFRAAYRALAPENYQGRVYLEQPLPELVEPVVVLTASFLREARRSQLRRVSSFAYEALFELQMPTFSDSERVSVFFSAGGERLQALELYVDLISPEGSAENNHIGD